MKAMTAGADSLSVTAGDNAMGTLAEVAFTTAAPDLTALSTLGYDVTTLGNHEFDFGPAALAKSLTAAQAAGMMVPVVATNIHFSATDPADDTLAALMDENGTAMTADMSKPLHRWVLKTTPNGLKVGFIGILGTDAAKSAPDKAPIIGSLGASMTEGFSAENDAVLFSDLQPVVDHLRNDLKADLVIALSHSGVDSNPAASEDELIAAGVSGIDVICSGHTHVVFKAKVVNGKNGKPTLVQQAGQFGQFLGKVTIKVDPMGAVSFDMTNTDVITVDDSIAWDSSVTLDALIKSVEAAPAMSGSGTFIEGTLNRILKPATPIVDDVNKVGDTFFYQIGKTGFDLDGLSKHKEVAMLALHADALLYAANKLDPTHPTNLSLTAGGEGVVRADIKKGKTGNIGFADVFRVLPLGRSPLDGSLGFPMARAGIWVAAVRAAFEVTAGISYHSDNEADQFISGGGVKVEYNTSLTPLDFSSTSNLLDPTMGRVTKITMASTLPAPGTEPTYDTVIFDKSNTAHPWYMDDALHVLVVATDYHLIQFASSIGAALYDPANPTQGLSDPSASAVKDAGGKEVKDWEVLAGYINSFATLPDLYNSAKTTYPLRMICSGPLCVQ
jgi:5'-nucleotidase